MYVPPRKLTCPLKRDHFKRNVVFQEGRRMGTECIHKEYYDDQQALKIPIIMSAFFHSKKRGWIPFIALLLIVYGKSSNRYQSSKPSFWNRKQVIELETTFYHSCNFDLKTSTFSSVSHLSLLIMDFCLFIAKRELYIAPKWWAKVKLPSWDAHFLLFF